MNPTLILQAQQRKAQIKNNGTVEQLREVLKAVWPEDLTEPTATSTFYAAQDSNHKRWTGFVSDDPQPNLVVIPVTDFYQPSFTWGQEVIYRGLKVKFVAMSPCKDNQAIIMNDGCVTRTSVQYLSPIPSKITPEQAAGEMYEMLKEIKEKETIDLYRINSLLNRIK